MAADTALESFRYALDRELLKLYVAILFGLFVADASRDAFWIVGHPRLVALVSAPFVLAGWLIAVAGIVGVLHYVLTDTE